MADKTQTWSLIHAQRGALADLLETLTPQQWATPSLCSGWTVKQAAAHVVAGAEQTPARFLAGMAGTGFRFNTMINRDVARLDALSTADIIARLRARTTTTNHPPGPAAAMLGEVVIHGEDIRRPLGLAAEIPDAAAVACLDMYVSANFPVGAKSRTRGLRLVATDVDWSHGSGPAVEGSGIALAVAITGRAGAADDLSGEGASTLRSRLPR